jgi:Flp pilus assembly protein TadG
MVEMVLVLPLLLLLLFGLAELSLFFGRWLVVHNAAREGVRELVLYRDECDPAAVEAEVKSTVQAYADALHVALDPASEIFVEGACQGRNVPARVRIARAHGFQVLPRLSAGLGPTLPLAASAELLNEGHGGG